MTSMLGRLIGEDIRLVTLHPTGALHAQVDRGQIEQVVLNLVVNARDAMPGGGTLAIETSDELAAEVRARAPADLPAGPLACLCVRDTGPGMEPGVVSRAFDPFFTTKEPGKGTGLGLSTVDGIVRQSGGLAWIESAPDAGTAVHVCLPRVTSGPPAVAAAPAREGGAASRAGTVLVVEDEREVRDLVAHVLEHAGYRVLVARDGQEAIEVAARAGPNLDLLLTDAVMPRMGGRELIGRLTVARPGLRTLLISGYSDDEPAAGGPAPAMAVLAKPFTPRALIERVRDCLAGRAIG
jgi:two-component system, cell cycle sensor histidine kinase and response regulator CckA